ncbi:MAG: hypothetical protein K8R58_14645 [Bacteroidales bacterium]|nr:hypothetical protein [Bacteroidales bacterium]
MRNYLLIIILCSLAILFACNNNSIEKEFYNEKSQLVKQEFYSNGNLKSSLTIIDKNKSEYLYIKYYDDGKIEDSAYYINDTISGLRKFYEKDLDLTHTEYYKNGLLNGIDKAVYSSGIYSYKGQRLNNLKVGEWKFYFPDGNLITYEYFNDYGKIKYLRKYNEDGELLKSIGTGIVQIIVPQDSVFVGDTINTTIELVKPPNCEVNLSINNFDNNNNFINHKEYSVKESKILLRFTFETPGTYIKEAIWKIKDLKTGKIEQGKSSFRIYVISVYP